LLPLDARLALDAGEDRRLVEPARQADLRPVAAEPKLRAAGSRIVDELLDARSLLLGDQRPQLGPELLAAADPQAPRPARELLDERLLKRPCDVDALDPGADLPAVRERTPQRA